jgi:hypothetical protein
MEDTLRAFTFHIACHTIYTDASTVLNVPCASEGVIPRTYSTGHCTDVSMYAARRHLADCLPVVYPALTLPGTVRTCPCTLRAATSLTVCP